ncbi:hypothetical protein Fot_47109 [Forsythia ovata]|uniref:Uncharacterized protein n=1 Tax=Forsythia ovata TaxID=205694 RepID=A0ABD1QPF6_9LAMI
MGEPRDQERIPSSTPSVLPLYESETEELKRLEHAPPFWRTPKSKKRLSKQLSVCVTPRNVAWEKRRLQFLRQERRRNGIHETDDLTDEDLNELKGCIELGFGFNEEEGQGLCGTIPALDLYFAVNRQFLTSPIPSPSSSRSAPLLRGPPSPSSVSVGGRSSSSASPRSESDWKICNPG